MVDAHLVQINLLASLSVRPQTLEDLDRYLIDWAPQLTGHSVMKCLPSRRILEDRQVFRCHVA